MTDNRFDDLDSAIAYAKRWNVDCIGYHQYAIKGGYYFAFNRSYAPLDNEYWYMDIIGKS